jgi:hypothetical protein
LTIKTREGGDSPSATQTTHTLYAKGAWQRRETHYRLPDGSAQADTAFIAITRCDDQTTVLLNPAARVFGRSKIMPSGSVRVTATKGFWSAAHGQQAAGAEVTTTVNTVDTGGRRKLGSHTARHIIKTTTTVPGPGAATPRSESVEDGWYIDLPSRGCRDEVTGGTALSAVRTGENGVPDRVKLQYTGNGRQGFPIEETKRMTADYGSYSSTITLLEFSESTLDTSLFDVPKGYRPALRRLGGFDMRQPDTIVNRITAYVYDMGSYARSWFGF